MKTTILTTLFLVLTLTSAFAQKKSDDQPNPYVKLTLTLTKNGISKTDSIKLFSYSLSKLDPDTLAGKPIKARLDINMDHINGFFNKAASGDAFETVDATIRYYNQTGKLIHTIQAKQAYVSFVTGSLSDRYHGGYNSSSLSLKTPILIIDGVKM